MKEVVKLERNGKIGVLISRGYGAGWSTWGGGELALFCPEIIELVEANKFDEITDDLCGRLFEDKGFYTGGAESLVTTEDLYYTA